MSERKTIRMYGSIIESLQRYAQMGMPLLANEQALLSRAIKSLSVCPSLAAQRYIHTAENILIKS